jgi:hypothetical protein
MPHERLAPPSSAIVRHPPALRTCTAKIRLLGSAVHSIWRSRARSTGAFGAASPSQRIAGGSAGST